MTCRHNLTNIEKTEAVEVDGRVMIPSGYEVWCEDCGVDLVEVLDPKQIQEIIDNHLEEDYEL